MANEAGVVVVVSMRDEASAKMQNFGKSMGQTRVGALEMKVAIMAVGTATAQLGSLLGALDDPLAKAAGRFFTISGYVVSTGVAITLVLPQIRMLITWLKQLNITMAVTQALSGPAGWITLLIASGVGIGAIALAKAAGGGGGGGGGRAPVIERNIVVNNNIAGSVISERELGDITRREIIKAQQRSAGSGIE